jgi:hypothetical protein
MRVPAFPIVASLVLLAAPAFAQSSTTTGATSDQNGATSDQSGVTSNSNSWHHDGNVSTDTKDKLRQSLESSGFKDVTVTPEAFMIRAQAPDGSRIVMMLRPDEMTGVIEPQTGSSTTPGNSSNYNSSNTQSGTSR